MCKDLFIKVTVHMLQIDNKSSFLPRAIDSGFTQKELLFALQYSLVTITLESLPLQIQDDFQLIGYFSENMDLGNFIKWQFSPSEMMCSTNCGVENFDSHAETIRLLKPAFDATSRIGISFTKISVRPIIKN